MTIAKHLFAGLAAAGLALGAGAAEARQLTASTHLPPKNNTMTDGYDPFVDAVKKATDGELTIKVFPGGSLLGPKAASEGIRDGVVDLGYVIVGYHPAEFPHMAFINDMAAIGSDTLVVGAATSELVMLNCQPCQDEFKARGNIFLGTYGVSPMVIMSAKPIDTVADLQGLKIRSAGSAWDHFVESVGAIPVNVPSSEQYEAMSRGMVDASFHVAASLKTYSLWDMTKDVIPVNVGAYRALNTFAFNPKTWASLTVDQRRIMLEAAADANIGVSAGYAKTDAEALAEADAKGFRVHEITGEFADAVAKYISAEKAGLIEVGKTTRGIADPEPLIAKMSELVDKWQAIVDAADGDVDAIRARFREDVLSKIDPATYGM